MLVIKSHKALADWKTQKDCPEWIVNLQFQLLRIRLSGEYISKVMIVNLILSSN
jgi:hypothetical protein